MREVGSSRTDCQQKVVGSSPIDRFGEAGSGVETLIGHRLLLGRWRLP